jgi:multidrug efflux pump subunit AcrA (membrane-fusion protein)
MQQNVVTYQAVIDVPNPGLKLRPGMTANIRIEIARKNDVVRVPNAATRFRPTTEMYVALGMEPPDAGRGRGGPGREGGRGGDLTAAAGPAQGPGQPTATPPTGSPQRGSGQQASGRPQGERGSSGGRGVSGGGGRGGGNGENGSDFSAQMRTMTPEERERMMRGRSGRGGSGREGSGRGGFGGGGDGSGRGRNGMNARDGQGRGGQRGGPTLTAAELAATRNVTTIDKLFPPLPSVERTGRVWTLKKEGEKQILTPHNVRLGVSDGTVTELIEGDVTEGQQLITTIITAQVRPAPGFGPQGGNPFVQQPGRGGPGGGRGPGGGGGGGGPQGGGGGGNRGGGGGGGRGGGF